MALHELLLQAQEIRPGDHLVALYREENEIEGYITSYIHAALAKNERCIYITGDANTSSVLDQVQNLMKEGQYTGDLVVLDKSDTYSKNGKFSPDKLINMIREYSEAAMDDGYTSLAITGEISWVLDYEDGEALIIEYEWKLNEYIFNTYPVSALCRYNIQKFSDDMVKNIIQLHPLIIWQYQIHENPYYIPPEGYKNNEISKYQVERWLQNISGFSDTKNRFLTLVEKKERDMQQLHQSMTNGIITGFLKLLESHDPYTKNHCANVSSLAVRLARRLQKSDDFVAKIAYASLVHDIGKVLIPKEILNKSGRLTAEEFETIKMHPEIGAAALGEMDQISEIAYVVKHHHERFDGSGYPDGLSGEQIPLMSRIIFICDSYDAITNDRPYRKAQSHDYAISEILAGCGTQFDANLVDHFVRLFRS